MNRKWKEAKTHPSKNSPVLFEDEEVGTSPNDVKVKKSSATPRLSKGHSTPIENRIKKSNSESPDLNYGESPIEPLTQNPPNEVGWDYRPVYKDEDETSPTSMDISRTPKRNVLLTKKRNSNSPLLYKPLKKKLIQEEQQEHMAGFMAELKAIAIHIDSKKDAIKDNEVPEKSECKVDSPSATEINSQPNESDIRLQVTTNTDDSSGQNKIISDIKNYSALLDDSIEDVMVMCSQKVEEEELAAQRKHNEPISTNSLQLEKVVKNHSKENIQPSNSNDKIVNSISSKNSSTSKTGESASLEIPDDSFDEFFVKIDDEEFCKNVNSEIIIDSVDKSIKYSNKPTSTGSTSVTASKSFASQNKFFQSKNSSHVTNLKVSIASTVTSDIKDLQASKASIQNKIVNTKANFGYLNKDYVKTKSSAFHSQIQTSHTSSSSIDKNTETRLLKAKSFSDSNFFHQQSNNFGPRSHSNINMNSMIHQRQQSVNSANQNPKSTCYTSGSSVDNKSLRRIHSSSSIGKANVNVNISEQSNRNASLSLSTPAEIERKRQEAIMKRQAKLKSKDNNAQLKRPLQYPIKR